MCPHTYGHTRGPCQINRRVSSCLCIYVYDYAGSEEKFVRRPSEEYDVHVRA